MKKRTLSFTEKRTTFTERESVVREYYEQQCASKLDNLDEIEKFLETHNVPRLNHEETDHLNRPTTRKQ